MIARKVGFALGLLHLLAFLLLVGFVNYSADPQTALLWGIFAIVDFPLSLLYFAAGALYSHGSHLLYFPYFIHGLLGTVWWFFLPRLVTPRRLGGVW